MTVVGREQEKKIYYNRNIKIRFIFTMEFTFMFVQLYYALLIFVT